MSRTPHAPDGSGFRHDAVDRIPRFDSAIADELTAAARAFLDRGVAVPEGQLARMRDLIRRVDGIDATGKHPIYLSTLVQQTVSRWRARHDATSRPAPARPTREALTLAAQHRLADPEQGAEHALRDRVQNAWRTSTDGSEHDSGGGEE